MEERDELEKAITVLEAQRNELGAAAADAALTGLYRRLSELDAAEGQKPAETAGTRRVGERRVVTILFCDVTGSTALAEKMDPEAWTGVMNAAFDHLIEPVKRYEGTVANLMGDALLAFFGAPAAHEDDPQRAVLAGLGMIANISPFREKLLQEKGINFNVRVGINTGLTFVGDVGSKTSAEYTAMGDAVNVAARMEQTAAPGTVQIAQDTYELVAPLFECKSLGGVTVKGKSQPVPAYQVLGRKAGPGRLRGLGSLGLSSPLVGREKELALAQRAVARLKDGDGGVLIVFGEAGVGKSRLMAELSVLTTTKSGKPQVIWLEGETQTYGQNISYWPFQQILRQYFGITEEDSQADAFSKLEQSVQRLFPTETAEVLPYLASLLALEVTDKYVERVKYLDGEGLGRQVYRACRLLFERLAEEQPILLIFEDLHWLDASSAGLLEHLLPLIERVPLLVCGLSRPDVETPGARLIGVAQAQFESRLTVIELAPLSPDNSRRLVHNLLEIDGLPEHVRQMMVQKSDGNPFFLEEIVRNLIDTGALIQDETTGRWRANRQIEIVHLPETIQGLLVARIDRLDDHLKQVVRRAAVIGRSFYYRILGAVIRDDPRLESDLEQLQAIDLIQEKQRIPELEYIFRHALTQEAAYKSILIQERREFHARVGQAIETLLVDRLEEHFGQLAYHYAAAENWEKAQDYLLKAADQAGRTAANAEALAYYHQAIDAYTRVHGESWEPLERARLERKIGEALFRLGKHSQARPHLEKALDLLGAGLPSSKAGIRRSILAALLVQATHWFLPQLFMRRMGQDLDQVAEEIFKTSNVLDYVEALSNYERSMLISLRTLNTCEREGYAFGSAMLTADLGLTTALIGQFGVARRFLRRSEGYANLTNPFRPVPELDVSWGMYYIFLSDLDRMVEPSLRGMEFARNAGDLHLWGLAKTNITWGYWGRADYTRAERECEELLQTAEDSSDQQLVAWGLLTYGVVRLRQGMVQEAIASFQRGIEIAKELPDYVFLSGLGGWMARGYVALGEVDRAIETLESITRIVIENLGMLIGYAYLGNGYSDAYLAKAEQSAGDERQAWLKKTRPILRRTLREAGHVRLVLPDAQLFQGRYEWLRGRPKKALEWWKRALAQAETTGLRYNQGVIHLEIGRRLGDREHLRQATTILEEIGDEHDLAQAREALENFRDDE